MIDLAEIERVVLTTLDGLILASVEAGHDSAYSRGRSDALKHARSMVQVAIDRAVCEAVDRAAEYHYANGGE